MPETTRFTAAEISALREKATHGLSDDLPYEGIEGWFKTEDEPMKLLKAFPPLSIKKGYALRGYRYVADGNGNGVVWAMPKNLFCPEPELFQQGEGPENEENESLYSVPRPDGALDDYMEAIEGDSSPWSYMCASILAREIAEYGAMWHGVSWGIHGILDAAPWAMSDEKSIDDLSELSGASSASEWEWSGEEPSDWRPSVEMTDAKVRVVFYTFSALGCEQITEFVDTFKPGAYGFSSEAKPLATGPGGFVF